VRHVKDTYGFRVYAPEALTPFSLLLRGRYPRFYGSEYSDDPAVRRSLYPIPIEDLRALSCPDASFHAVVCNDVFEHVPGLDRCLAELRRVLQPGGVLLSTFPFAAWAVETTVKARLGPGGVEYLMEPEYHGNPVEPHKGSLVYQIPGWDILDMCRQAGFSVAEMVFVSSTKRGILGADTAGVQVLRARA
jgi:SAM-dependent methyltransferase